MHDYVPVTIEVQLRDGGFLGSFEWPSVPRIGERMRFQGVGPVTVVDVLWFAGSSQNQCHVTLTVDLEAP